MKMAKSPAAVALLIGLTFISCKSGVKQHVVKNPHAQHRILITGTTSEFKQVVVDGLVVRFEDRCQIEIQPMGKLSRDDLDAYIAIVIMDECQAWMAFNSRTLDLIKKIEEKDKIVLFITAGDPGWTFSTQGIDAITSASVKGREGEVVERIAARIEKLLR
jgi:hypothetical protein